MRCLLLSFAGMILAILGLIVMGGIWDAWMGGNEGHP